MSETDHDITPSTPAGQSATPGRARLYLVASGDPSAFRELFNEYWDNIYGVALALTKSETNAEDMTQDVFLKVWTKRAELPTIERFDDWLFIITRNHIFSELQKLKTRRNYTDRLINYFASRQTVPTPEGSLLAKESARLIDSAVAGLSPQQKQIYRLSRDQGLMHQSIANQLGLSKNTVRNHMAAALKNIRDYLETHADGGLLLAICLFEAFL